MGPGSTVDLAVAERSAEKGTAVFIQCEGSSGLL